MFRPNREIRSIDLDPKLSFDDDQFDLEKAWLNKQENGALYRIETDPENFLVAFFSAVFWSLFLGTIPVLMAIYVIRLAGFYNAWALVIIMLFYPATALLLLIKFRQPYSIIEFDPDSEIFMYNGVIDYAGEERKVRYLGSIEVVERTEIVSRGTSKRKYIRLITNSGYLRLPGPDKLEGHVKTHLSKIQLVDADTFQNLPEIPIEEKFKWNIYYKKQFDRSEFYQKRRKSKEKKNEEKRTSRLASLEAQYKAQQEEE